MNFWMLSTFVLTGSQFAVATNEAIEQVKNGIEYDNTHHRISWPSRGHPVCHTKYTVPPWNGANRG